MKSKVSKIILIAIFIAPFGCSQALKRENHLLSNKVRTQETKIKGLKNKVAIKAKELTSKIDKFKHKYKKGKQAIKKLISENEKCSTLLEKSKERYNALRWKYKKLQRKSIKSIIWKVKKNDWLSKIAAFVYGDYKLWPILWKKNKDKVKNPDLIYPGQRLQIEAKYTKKQKEKAIKLHEKRY